MPKREPTQKIEKFNTSDSKADSEPYDNKMEVGPVNISKMDLKIFIMYSKWSKYSEATQKNIISERNLLGVVNGKKNMGNKIPMVTTIQAATINNFYGKYIPNGVEHHS